MYSNWILKFSESDAFVLATSQVLIDEEIFKDFAVYCRFFESDYYIALVHNFITYLLDLGFV